MAAATPSTRLVRAAVAEQSALLRKRQRLVGQREDLRARLEALEADLLDLDERLELLGRIAPQGAGATVSELPVERTPAAQQHTLPGIALSGEDIRYTAVEVLRASSEGAAPIHYRRWYELLEQAGYRVSGKDPQAVFLTQVSRSPLVARTSRPGVYELDRDAVTTLREQVLRLTRQLRDLPQLAGDLGDLQKLRTRREDLAKQLSRAERALDEALRATARRPYARHRASS